MTIKDLLDTRRNEINVEIAKLQEERSQIDRIIPQLNTPTTSTTTETVDAAPVALSTDPKIAREQAIIDAVAHGNTRPKSIDRYLRQNLKMRLNIGSLRSTLSRLKTEQKINHNETGWVL